MSTMLKSTFLKYLESKIRVRSSIFQIVAQNMALKNKFYDFHWVKPIQDYTCYTIFFMAELMRPRGKPFDKKKPSKIQTVWILNQFLYEELILNPRKFNVLKKLTLNLKEQKIKRLVPKPVKVFRKKNLRKTEESGVYAARFICGCKGNPLLNRDFFFWSMTRYTFVGTKTHLRGSCRFWIKFFTWRFHAMTQENNIVEHANGTKNSFHLL